MTLRPPSSALSARVIGVLLTACVLGCLVFAASLWLFHHRHTAGIDRRAFDVLGASRHGLLEHVARPLAVIGTVGLALAGAATILVLLKHRAWPEAIAIVAGGLLCGIIARAIKLDERRPRPAGGLLPASGYSFPSTSSALAVGALAMAIAVARLMGPGPARNRLVAGGAVLTVGAGLLFVALRVHYLSDVIAGWALGVAVFSGCALVLFAARAGYARIRGS